MARIGRIVVPGFPHHVTQRGNRRQPVFFEPSDCQLYRDLLAEHCRRASVEVWAYCLMPNHVHLVLTPRTPHALARAIGETHRQYTAFINARARWTGHLFQGRFSSVALDEAHLAAAARYVALNPVRAKLAARAQVHSVFRRSGNRFAAENASKEIMRPGRAPAPISRDAMTAWCAWRR